MRKRLVFVLILSLIALNVFARTFDTDLKNRSMALSGIGDKNPASLFLDEKDTNFIVSLGYSGEAYVKTDFIGERISFALDIDYLEKNINDLQRDVSFNFNAAAGFDYLGVGVGIYGGSSMEQQNVTNLIYQIFFGDFIRIEESQFVSIRLGTMYKLNNYSFALMADDVLSYNGLENRLTLDNAFNHISGGVYWNQSKYAKRGRLNKWVFGAGVEALNIFNREERALATGFEATIQLASDYSVSFRGGLRLPLFNDNQSYYTVGLGAKVNQFDLCGFIAIPGRNYMSSSISTINFNISFVK